MRALLRSLPIAAVALAAACSDSSTSGGTSPTTTGSAVLSGAITTNRTLSKDTTYTLSGYVTVANGVILTIPAGTKLVGDTLISGSALFILRGARIIANGTSSEPIVFTSARSAGNRRPGDWGGLILVGNARNNRSGTVIVEGSGGGPGTGTVGIVYTGGTDDTDNSGILRYVRVEFAGFAVAPAEELNSFTFAAIGSGTTLEYLQSMAGLDDSFEWFGGTVDAKYLVSYESGDDHFDTSEGYRGRVQFLIGLQTTVIGPTPGTGSPSLDPQGFEVDGCNGTGCTAPVGGNAQSSGATTGLWNMNTFANFTLIGPGAGVLPVSQGIGAVLRRGTGGTYVNGVFGRWPTRALTIRDSTSNNRLLVDSLTISNIFAVENGANTDPGSATEFGTQAAIGANIDSAAAGVTAASVLGAGFPAAGLVPTVGTLNWQPGAGSPIATGGLASFAGTPRIAARAGSFITPTAYRGAVSPTGPAWYSGWTVYYRN